MAASVNKVMLMGNLTRDPQVRYTSSGKAVTDIGLAMNNTWFDKQSNQKKEEVTFVDVTLWGRDAEVAGEYLSKGRSVFIEGRLQLDQWDDKETGQKKSRLKVTCERMQMVGGRADGEGGGGGGPAPARAGGGRPPQGGGRKPAGRPQPAEEEYSGGADTYYDNGPGDDIPQDEVPF